MFEREVMIVTLKRQNEVLGNLIHEMEEKPKVDPQESRYFQEALKKIELSLKRLRRLEPEEASIFGFGSGMKYQASPMRMRDIS